MVQVWIAGIGPLQTAVGSIGISTDGAIQTSVAPVVPNDVVTLASLAISLGDYVRKDGTTPLTADWDVGAAGNLVCDRINARNSDGLLLMDDGGNYGLHVRDGGNVSIGKLAGSGYKFRVNNSGFLENTYFGLYAYHAKPTGPEIHIVHSRSNTMDTFGTTSDGDDIGVLKFYGVNSLANAWASAAQISVVQKGAAGATYLAANLNLETYSGSALNSNQLVLKNDSKVGVGKVPSDSQFEVNGSAGVTMGSSFRIGGITETGNDGLRLTAIADYGYIDLKGGGRILVRVDDVNGGTEVLGIATDKVTIVKDLELRGGATLGNAGTDVLTCNGRLVHRTLSADPTSSATAGNLGEIAFYNDNAYVKTVDTGTNTNWKLFSTGGLAGVLLANGTVGLSADWNLGDYKIGLGRSPSALVDVNGSGASATFYFRTYLNGSGGSELSFMKSRSNVIGTETETQDTDSLGRLNFLGVDSDGRVDFGASIRAIQVGAASNKVGTKLVFTTYSSTAENANLLVLAEDGNIGVAQVPSGSYKFDVNGSGKFSSTLGVDGKLSANGSVDLGDDSSDVITCYGRLVLREIGIDPTSVATYGVQGEIVVYSDDLYLKTVGTGTDTNWKLI